jgi:predicted kinase
MVIIVMGLPGSGKSYFASRLATDIEADYINSDSLRKMMIPQRTYSPKEKQLVYSKMLALMKLAIKQKKDIVLDGTFYKRSIRNKFTDEAGNATHFLFIEVRAAESLIGERLKQTRADSEADYTVYKIVQAQWEPLQEKHLILQSTNDNINDMLQTAIDYLRKQNDKRTN